jgi:hypothetical protein
MRKFTLAFLALSLLPLLASAQSTTEKATLQNHAYETNLPTDSTLRLHLHEGDFRIEGTDSEKISIHVDGKNIDQSKDIKINLKRTGKIVDLTLSNVPKKELVVTISIPKSTTLYTRMRGGDLSVSNIIGDKDLELTGGDLTLQVANPEDYSHVDLSVKFGNISGNQFGDPKGSIGNSIRKEGTGKFRLHAHVMAGDLLLKS